MEPSEQLRTFFTSYEAAGNEMDVDRLAEFFGDTCLAAAPGFAGCTTDRGQLSAALTHMGEFYRGIGRGEVRVVDLDEHALGAFHSLVTVQWTASFPTIVAPIPFQVSYLVQHSQPPRIIAFVSHEDEQALLRQHGLLPPE